MTEYVKNQIASLTGDQKKATAYLTASMTGRLILPGDSEYEAARSVFSGEVDHHPLLIARVASPADVAHVIKFAQETGLPLAVRSGGHSAAGHSVADGGVVIDLRDLKALHIDAEKRTAWAETGLTAGEYTAAADRYGLATGFGDTGSVGLGGITLGGGVGYLVRKHGLTIDNLLSAELVTADGRHIRVDSGSHPDLFWALRGGGGNFGVATRFQYRLHPLEQIVGGMLFLPASPEIIAGFISAAEAAPEELSTIANVMPAPPMPMIPAEYHGKLIVMAMMVYAGEVDAGLKSLQPFRRLARPIADLLKPGRYTEMFPPEEGDYHPTAVSRSMFLDRVDLDTARVIFTMLSDSQSPMRVAQLRVLGGVMARIAPDATAFAHRNSRIMVNLASFYSGPEDRQAQEQWIQRFAAAIEQSDRGVYVNFLGNEGQAAVRAAYPPATWLRLAEIKARYDPGNLFRLNQNIPPAKND